MSDYTQFDEILEDYGMATIDVLVFLDHLRESGQTNMFGARPYIEGSFGIGRKLAGDLLTYWMTTFEARHPA